MGPGELVFIDLQIYVYIYPNMKKIVWKSIYTISCNSWIVERQQERKTMNKDNKKMGTPLDPRLYLVIKPVLVKETGQYGVEIGVETIPAAIYDQLLEKMQTANKLLAEAFETGEMNLTTEIKIKDALTGGNPVEFINVDLNDIPVAPEKRHDPMYG